MNVVSNLVYLHEEKLTTDSQKLSEAFGNQHKNVLQKIDRILADTEENFIRLNFQPVDYSDAKGESRRMFRMTRDGFLHIALTFTGKRGNAFRAKVIQDFSEMEEQLSGLGLRKEMSTEELLDWVYADRKKQKERADKAEGTLTLVKNRAVDHMLAESYPSVRVEAECPKIVRETTLYRVGKPPMKDDRFSGWITNYLRDVHGLRTNGSQGKGRKARCVYNKEDIFRIENSLL